MKIPYYIFSTGYLHRKQNTFHIEPKETIDDFYAEKEETACVLPEQQEQAFQPKNYLPVHQVEALYCYGETAFSSPALRLAGKEGIPVHFFDFYGKYYGSFFSRESASDAPLVLLQAQHYLNEQLRLKLVTAIVGASVYNMDQLLHYYDSAQCNLTYQRVRIQEMHAEVTTATGLKRIGGAEGFARRCYYAAIKKILAPIPFEGRVVRPPDSLVNAMLSFGYAMLYTQLCSELFRAGLSPYLSVVHEPRERRFSLALDLADIFKPLFVDRLVLKLLQQGVITEQQHSVRQDGGVYLTKEGTQLLTMHYDQEMKHTIYHPRYKRAVSFRTLLRLECLHLAGYLRDGIRYEPCTLWS